VDDAMTWTPLEKMLFTTAIPLAALVIGLALVTLASRSEDATYSSAAQPAPAPAVSQRLEAQRSTVRQSYAECIDSLSGDYPRFGLRARLAARDDLKKARSAAEVCQTLVQYLGRPAPPRRATAQPLVA
jgi:hypothetical protein